MIDFHKLSVSLAVTAAALTCAASASAAPAPGTIDTVAGTGAAGSTGDGGQATAATLTVPFDVDVLPTGGYLIVDAGAYVIRRVSSTGVISTVAGQAGVSSSTGDGGPATSATLDAPTAVAALPDGGFLIADVEAFRVRKVDAAGTISTVAGGGTGFTDGADATSVALRPYDVSVLPGGAFLVAGFSSCKVYKVDVAGKITIVAGSNACGDAGDGGAATAGTLDFPTRVSAFGDGSFLVNSDAALVRKVDAGGTLSTVAGTGVTGFSGDGGPATAAQLGYASGLAAVPSGGFLFSDLYRVRAVDAAGTVTTVAGTGEAPTGPENLGDGGPATAATLRADGIAAMPDGGFVVADGGTRRIRRVYGTTPPDPVPPLGPPPAPAPAPAPPPKVLPPSNAFRLAKVSTGKGGSIKVTLTFPAPGRVKLTATAGKVTYASKTAKVKQGRTTITLKPGRRGRALRSKQLRRHRALKVRLVQTFTPTGGTARKRSTSVTVVKAHRRSARR